MTTANFTCLLVHCWDYRSVVCGRLNIDTLKELDFTLSKIQQNFSNFSAWHYRSSLFTEADNEKLLDFKNKWHEEYGLVQDAIFTDPTDQSAWFYHKWLSSVQFGADMRSTFPKDEGKVVQLVLDHSSRYVFVKLSRFVKCWRPEWIAFGNDVDEQVDIDVKPLSGQASDIWFATLPATVTTIKIRSADAIKLDNGEKSRTIVWSEASAFKPEKFEVTDEHLQNLKQLYEMEPDNKWIARALSTLHSANNRLETLDDLIELDPLRRHYYADQSE